MNFIYVFEKLKHISLKQFTVIIIHALVVWILCGLTIGIGRNVTTMELTLIIHAIGAPVFAGLASFFYHSKFNYTKPIQTATIFLLFVIIMDAGLVAPVFEKSFEMFTSVFGTWIPLVLIFSSTYIIGLKLNKKVS